MKIHTNWKTAVTIICASGLLITCSNRYTCRESARPVPSTTTPAVESKTTTSENTSVIEAKPAPTSLSNTTEAPQVVKNQSTTAWLETRGNKIYTSDGIIFRGRGANIHDTRSCNACTWNKPNVDEVKRRIDALVDDWGANFVRLLAESYDKPAGRVHYQGVLDDQSYLRDLVEIVSYIGTKPNTYVLVSLWTEPSEDKNGWPTAKTIPVWKTLAEALVDMPQVMFGVINEPHGNWNGDKDKEVWDAMNNVVKAIRAIEKKHGSPKHLIAVQGTRKYARYLGYYVDHPITAGKGENIIYETHSYLRPPEYEENWLGPAQTLPVIIGEFGPADLGGGYKMTTEHTIVLMDEAEKHDISWLAWTFHMRCAPNLLKDNSNGTCGYNMKIEPSEWGEVIKTRLATPWKRK